MDQNSWFQGWRLGLASSLVFGGMIVFSLDCASAQIFTDKTLLTPSILVKNEGCTECIITGGTTIGNNLFHSFERFSLPDGSDYAYFDNAFTVQNIIARVTGGFASEINGTLAANGTANLFLINPNGIILGETAQLNINGSFVATTADAIQFGDQGFFSASSPNIPAPLLTVNPSAFVFNQLAQQPPNSIEVRTELLSVREGQSLLLLGGDVILENSNLYVDYFEGGRIEIGGVAGTGAVGLNMDVDGSNLSLSFPDNLERADVSLSDTSLDVSAEGGGSIAIYARNLDIAEDSFLFAGIGSGLGSADSQAGDITLNATATLTITNSYVVNVVDSGATGNGGDINIQAGSFSAEDSLLEASSYGQGDAGSISVQVNDSVSLLSSAIFSNVEAEAVGTGGNINIQSGSFSAENAWLDTSTSGQGDAGSVFVEANDAVSFSDSWLSSNVAPGTVGDGGDIDIKAGSISITDAAQLSTNIFGEGKAGNISLQADGAVSLATNAAIFSQVEAGGVGEGGDINIKGGSLSMTDGAELQTFVGYDRNDILPGGRGDAGDVNIDVSGSMTLVGQGRDSGTAITAIFAGVGFGAEGNGGDININANSLSVTNGVLGADTNGYGDAGKVTVRVAESISLTNTDNVLEGNRRSRIGSAIGDGAVGDGGDIDIQARSLSLANGATLDASTQGDGTGGNIKVSVDTITATNGGQIFTTTRSNGQAGSISLDVTDDIILSGSDPLYAERLARTHPGVIAPDSAASGVFARTEGGGAAGDVQMTTGQLVIQNGAAASTASLSAGQGGNLTVRASQLVKLTGTSADGQLVSSLSTETLSSGDAGNLQIFTGQLIVQDGAKASAATASTGAGGSLTVKALDLVQLSGGGSLSTETSGAGDAGSLTISTAQLNVEDEASVSASTANTGNSGSLRINASNSVQLSNGGGLLAQSTGEGDAGDLQIFTGRLIVQDRATASVGTEGSGAGGSLTVNASELVQLSGGGGLFTETSGSGDAGSLTISTTQLNVEDDALISASTSGTGKGGILRINASNSVQLSNGGGLFAQSTGGGNAGDLQIFTGQMTVQDQAQITVSSQGSSNAGNLQLTADSLFLDNQAKLQAETASGDGGNITLRLQDFLLMRYNSLISTTAGTAGAGGDGGNIDINARFIVAVPSENSDITANAFEGRGGNVSVTTQGIFGTQFRPQLTPESDITASSQFGVNGSVQINTPGIDPSQGLTNLPADLVDAANQITQNCATGKAGTSEQSKFTIVGSGGLPPSPIDALSSDAVQVDWVALKPSSEHYSRSSVSISTTSPKPVPILEAQGWVINEKGKIALVASAPIVTPHLSWQTTTACHASQSVPNL